MVLAEDTRVTAKLMNAYGLSKKLERYDEHAADRAAPKILKALADGARVALVSDAGTPMVSDPGFRLARDALAQGTSVFPAPGASAVLAGLAVSGLPTDMFMFAGFPPPKSAARRTFLDTLSHVPATLVFFEGSSRVAASLKDMAEVLGPRPAAVARELTKLYETVSRGTLDTLATNPDFADPRGEFVILVGPGLARSYTAEQVDQALSDAMTRLRPADAAAEVSKAFGLPRRELYNRVMALRAEDR